ncbi:hypothetical protein IFM89_005487 [Coptis chinensis]|uniref:Uncharacterized protein n=1 Tax=Coptis chinensis TaxID=261450 RepID=A0A835IAN3_9MAGN|nr:hypothetical protein IFM89_005487 [Coptis chinensis]
MYSQMQTSQNYRYLSRDLVKLVENDPPGIMLLFEPKGRPEDEDNDFYIQSKKNICVGCGERNHYLRYRIVPSCYRMHFPEHLKSHRSHDIVLLCVDCHEVAHSVAEKHKRQIAAEFGIPLFVKKVTESSQTDIIDGTSGSEENVEAVGVSPLQLRAAAMALLRHGPNMPAKRREELTLIMMKYFGGRKISTDDLESALLVGMSPHQRRKHEKKRGLPFKHSMRGHLSNEANSNNADSIRPYTLTEAIKWDYKNGPETATEANLGMVMDASTRNIHIGCDSKVKGDAATTDGEDLNFNISSISNKGKAMDTDEDLEDKSLSDFTYNSSQCKPSGTVSSTYNQKMSLLGHGPHGKQVVDHLLKKYGEDIIRVFCQRWRQVFVGALHPRFLPSGWDVNHRGRWDFGEYSVYNPIKKSMITATD